jgi:hypothetical protein
MKDKRRRRYLIGANRPRFYRYLVVAGSKKPPPNPCRIADCGGSPSSCRSAVPKDFCSWHGSSAPAKDWNGRCDAWIGSARAPNCLLIRTVALDVQSDTGALGAERYYWNVSAFGERQVAEGRVGEFAEARLHAEAALAVYMGGPDGQKSRTPAAARPASASAGCHRFPSRCKKIHPVRGQGG